MSIFINADTKLIVQGMTGSEGTKHTRRMIASGTNVVGGVTPKAESHGCEMLPTNGSIVRIWSGFAMIFPSEQTGTLMTQARILAPERISMSKQMSPTYPAKQAAILLISPGLRHHFTTTRRKNSGTLSRNWHKC